MAQKQHTTEKSRHIKHTFYYFYFLLFSHRFMPAIFFYDSQCQKQFSELALIYLILFPGKWPTPFVAIANPAI